MREAGGGVACAVQRAGDFRVLLLNYPQYGMDNPLHTGRVVHKLST
jgi:hypothetical protein